MTPFEHLVELSFTFLAFLGVVLIAYGGLAAGLKNPWGPLDTIADKLSQYVTLVSVAFVGLAVYLPASVRSPDGVTRFFFAPAILVLVIGALALGRKNTLPPHVTNGFAILGLAASMLRALPFSSGT